MTFPTNTIPLIDGDILRYELGFAAETGWRAITEREDAIPPFGYVEDLFQQRLASINNILQTEQDPIIIFTKGKTFRYDIAKRKPYKGTRKEHKPWHYNNLTVYMKHVLGAIEITHLEADDLLSVIHTALPNDTVICSRDKDLRQVPGLFYSWELGRQPSYGPILIDPIGSLQISDDNKKVSGSGLSFFYAQVLMGDSTDNIPGLPKCGPVATMELLDGRTPDEMLEAVKGAYQDKFDNWEEELLEQGRLCWMTRRLTADGKEPVLWEIGMME